MRVPFFPPRRPNPRNTVADHAPRGEHASFAPKASRWGRLGMAVSMTMGVTILGACGEGCRATRGVGPQGTTSSVSTQEPTIRLFVLSDVAGALEPCGCVKDQLGGLDHLAAWMRTEKKTAPRSLLVSAGPLFFMDPEVVADRREQAALKADTMAKSLAGLDFAAFTPGLNDYAFGAERLAQLAKDSKGAMLMANYADASAKTLVREIAGVRVGFVGIGPEPGQQTKDRLAGSPSKTPAVAAADGVAELKRQGAQIFVALASVGRGEAKRIADTVPELHAIVVGSPESQGENNSTAPPAERIGQVLIAQAGNHLTSVVVLDWFVRDQSFSFQDGSNLELGRKREESRARIDELRGKIATWEKEGKVSAADIAARRADLAKLESERDALDKTPAPAQGSFFRYTVKEVRDSLGKDDAVTTEILAYYKQVNARNKELFKDRKPRPFGPKEAAYVGVDVCTTCHKDARAVWDKTAHAHAYETLSKEYKEYNLDCVSCHVTGYDMPGGSTVTHVSKLKDVQCETCHGPGSKHALDPTHVKPLISAPSPDACLSCHHPPHVHTFNAAAKMEDILGPGHGR